MSETPNEIAAAGESDAGIGGGPDRRALAGDGNRRTITIERAGG